MTKYLYDKILGTKKQHMMKYKTTVSRIETKLIENINMICGASVAQWSEHSPFTPEAASSILRENFLNVTRTQCSTHVKRVSQHSAESRGFLRALQFPPTGKLTGCVRINTAREVNLNCCKNS